MVVCMGTMAPPVLTATAEHVIGNNIVIPGVGYVEMASSQMFLQTHATVTFVRPCSLGDLDA